jgi:N-acetylmuramoyl-L-alanine amidase
VTDHELIATLPARTIVGLTIYGEARGYGEGIEGRAGVANVIRNRVKAQRPHFGLTASEVCLKPLQFSCWTPVDGPTNYATILYAARLLASGQAAGPRLAECLWIADGMLSGLLGDNTNQATHYLTADLLAQKPPAWTKGLTPVARIHSHVFFIAD